MSKRGYRTLWVTFILFVIGLVVYKSTPSTPILPGSNEYNSFNTGILVGDHTWCDDHHVLAKQGSITGPSFRPVEGRFIYFDVTHPSDQKLIDLSKYVPLFGIHPTHVPFCKGNEIVFYRYQQNGPGMIEVYSLNIDKHEIELLAEVLYGGTPSQMSKEDAKYMLASRHPVDIGIVDDNRPVHDECVIGTLKPGYQVVCTDKLAAGNQPLRNTIVVNNFRGLLLKDTKYQTIANLEEDPNFWIERRATISPDEEYIYSGCIEKTTKDRESADLSICHYRLDGIVHTWTKVLSFNAAWNERTFFAKNLVPGNILVAGNGDIYFTIRGSVFIGVIHFGYWKYSAKNRNFAKICESCWLSVSPDGQKIALERADHQFVYYEIRSTKEH